MPVLPVVLLLLVLLLKLIMPVLLVVLILLVLLLKIIMWVLLVYKRSTSGVNPVSRLPSISWNLIGQIPNISTNKTNIFSINFVCSLYPINNNSARVVKKTEEAENVYIVE